MNRRNCWICKVCRDGSERPPSNLTVEEVLQWAQSFEKLMATKYGPAVYAAYLKMEYSDENMQFWMACETYKKIASRRSRASRAKKLYEIYIQPESPREINIDSSTREAIMRNIQEPTQSCFEEAQKVVYMHMERDSYPRFLKSEMYQKLLKTIQSNNNSWWPLRIWSWRCHFFVTPVIYHFNCWHQGMPVFSWMKFCCHNVQISPLKTVVIWVVSLAWMYSRMLFVMLIRQQTGCPRYSQLCYIIEQC